MSRAFSDRCAATEPPVEPENDGTCKGFPQNENRDPPLSGAFAAMRGEPVWSLVHENGGVSPAASEVTLSCCRGAYQLTTVENMRP